MKEPQSSSVIVARYLVWPGSYSFFYNGKVQQIYLGYGHKFCYDKKNFPVNPPVVMDDPEEYEDGPEPTQLEEPVKDQEKAEGEEGEGNNEGSEAE